MKFVLILLVAIVVLVGGAYGLAKLQVIPTQKLAAKNPALAKLLKPLGLYKPPPPPAPATPTVSPEQVALKAQREVLEKERADWESQKQAQSKLEEKSKQDQVRAEETAIPDPTSMSRLASIYEQMPPDKVVAIFKTLPRQQIIALLRLMDEKKVSEILALVPAKDASDYTQQLVKAAPSRTASNLP